MKKALLLLLALCGVSALQAVTVTWTMKLGGTNPDNAAESGFGPGYVGLCYVEGALNTIADADIAVNGNNTDYTLSGNLADATKIKVTDANYYADLGNSKNGEVTLTFSADVTSSSVTFVLFNGWNLQNSTAGYALYTITDISSTTTAIDLSDTTFEWTKTEVKHFNASAAPSVPEPTALALLALGVAGLALKRKVA